MSTSLPKFYEQFSGSWSTYSQNLKKNPPATFYHANKQLTNVDEISTTTKDVISPLNV